MNPHDPFEERLRRQPLRRVPREWREDILAAASAASRERELAGRRELQTGWRVWLQSLFWPAPRAWAGLAAAWVVILLLNVATREPATPSQYAAQRPPDSPAARQLLREQQQLFAELAEPREHGAVNRHPQPAVLSPRSDARATLFYV